MLRFVVILSALSCACMQLLSQTIISLNNGMIEADILSPDSGYYKGARFETAGFIHRLQRGTFICTGFNYQGKRDATASDHVCGNAEEFTVPLKVASQQAFLKIGNGIFRDTPDRPYDSNAHYECMRRFDWQMEKTPDSISFVQSITPWYGYAYTYRKTIRLIPNQPVLEIAYDLTNTGSQEIHTQQYAHNFTSFNRTLPVGTKVTWKDCIAIRPKSKNPPYDWQGSTLELKRPGRSFFTFIDFKEGKVPKQPVITIDFPTGAQVVIQEHVTPSSMAFHMSSSYLCPETFVSISLKPGETQSWKRSYRIR